MSWAVSASTKCSTQASTTQAGASRSNPAADLVVGEDSLRVAHVPADGDHPGEVAVEQRPGMQHGYRVVVHVRHHRVGHDRAGCLVGGPPQGSAPGVRTGEVGNPEPTSRNLPHAVPTLEKSIPAGHGHIVAVGP
jgi:hypothetical protein